MDNHIDKLFEIIFIAIKLCRIVEGFYVDLPFLDEIPAIIVVHEFVAGIFEGQANETFSFYLGKTHLSKFCPRVLLVIFMQHYVKLDRKCYRIMQ